MRVFIYEDDDLLILNLRKALKSQGLELTSIDSPSTLINLNPTDRDLIIIDLNYRGERLSGIEFLKRISMLDLKKYVLTGVNEEMYLKLCYTEGADQVYTKASDFTQIMSGILDHFGEENGPYSGCSEAIRSKYKVLRKMYQNGLHIILYGESGAGKTYIAKKLFDLDKNGSFVSVNCSAIPESLAESHFFGHKKGAFTGATGDHAGFLKKANGGTLFLDEVSTLPLELQAKLLKAVDEGVFYPLGSDKEVKCSFKIISATNESIPDLIREKKFREDLYYRLNQYALEIPPLRERKEDILKYISDNLSSSSKKVYLEPDALKYLCSFMYPGNYRDLKKLVDLIKIQFSGFVKVDDIKTLSLAEFQGIDKQREIFEKLYEESKEIGIKKVIDHIYENIVDEALKNNNGQLTKALNAIGMSRNKYYYMQKNKAINNERRH